MPQSNNPNGGLFKALLDTVMAPFAWTIGYIVGLVSPLVSGGGLLRALEQASNIDLPNEIPDVGQTLELFRRGKLSREAAESIMLRHGYAPDTTGQILSLAANLLSIADLTALAFKKAISEDEYYSLAGAIGVSREQAQKYLVIGEPRLDILTVMSAWRRGFFNPGSANDYFNDLSAQGWTNDRIEVLKKVTSYIPPPTDLIRFLLRDVYIPEYVETYGMAKEYPEAADADFAKLGIDHETALKYWEAHWELPSITQAYSMYQRKVITKADLARLLRAQGVEPYWRDKLIEVSYHPFTRIDVRRMMQYGTLDLAAGTKALEDVGYSPEQAKQLADFFKSYNDLHPVANTIAATKVPAQYHGMSESLILESYDDEIITRDQALTFLADINVQKDVANMLLSLHDYRKHKTVLKDEVAVIENSFLLGASDLEQAMTALGALGLSEAQLSKAVASMQRTRRKQAALPTRVELKKFFEAKAIDALTYVKELRNLGYADKYIQWYLVSEGLTLQEQQIALQK